VNILCIALFGARPVFYLVPVTEELNGAVAHGPYTWHATVVKKCLVFSLDLSHRLILSMGMNVSAFS
jgi:hypothetical protein